MGKNVIEKITVKIVKILLIHTAYQQRGGEDIVFEQECQLLKHNNDVEMLVFQNKSGLSGALQFVISIWNCFAAKKVREKIRNFRPDVIHIHNWHFSTGPIIIRTVKKMKYPLVVTLHNYRLLCPSAVLLHRGQKFENSLFVNFPWMAVRKKVYRNSFIQTFWLSFIICTHKKIGTWNKPNKYIALTEFSKDLFVNHSLKMPFEKIVVKPNFVHESDNGKDIKKEDIFLFIGRLSEEKGIINLLSAFKRNELKLRIGGTGPLVDKVKETCTQYPNIEYLGVLKKEQVTQQMQECFALVFPSTCYEGMPMVILEAFSLKMPVIASKTGAMKTMIKHGCNGFHFEPENIDDLCEITKKWAEMTNVEKEKFYYNAGKTYKELYTPEKNMIQLMDIYKSVIEENRET